MQHLDVHHVSSIASLPAAAKAKIDDDRSMFIITYQSRFRRWVYWGEHDEFSHADVNKILRNFEIGIVS